jgi:hypothetical protein
MTENFSGQSGAISGTWAGAGQAGSPDLLAEYRLPRQYQRPCLTRFIVFGVLAGLVSFGVVDAPNPVTVLFLAAFGIPAVYNGAMVIWRSRFRTRVTTHGIEIRGYFNHFVPWADVQAIKDEGYGDSRPLDTGYGGTRTSSGRAYRGGSGSLGMGSTGRRARLGVVRIFRRHGKSMMLRAPLVTAWAPDPQFSNKLAQMQTLSAQYGTRPVGS